jgi:hypothetical protein
MKLCTAFPAFILLIAFAAVTSAQTPPPLKMGLWEHQVTVQMSGMPNGMDSSHTIVKQSCFTPDTWKNTLQNMQQHPPAGGLSCSTSNMQQDPHHIAFDVQCSTSAQPAFTTNMHIEMNFDSDESMHGSTATTMSGPNMPQGMSVNTVIKSKFVSSDCGSVKPDGEKDAAPPGGPPPQ